MASTVFSLFLLVQLPRIYASGLQLQTTVCNGDHIAYSDSYGRECFYLNGNHVDQDSFCKALHFYHANGCIFDGFHMNDYCKLDASMAELPSREGRKLMQKNVREELTTHDIGRTAQPDKEKNDSRFLSTPQNVGIIASGAFVVCCAFLCPCFYRKRKATAHAVLANDPSSTDSISPFEVNLAPEKIPEKIPGSPLRVPPSPSRFSMSPKLSRLGSVHLNLSQVARATRNFSPSQRIGEGGFGTVYKARLDDGNIVAVKRAKKEHFESLQTEFSSEVEVLAKIDHRNLVKLLGYINKGNERLIITEYVPNGTLREHLDGQHGKILDFNQRLEISIDVAHALTYLHLYTEKQIIHRDVKSSNILLTESMRPKVADFGFARLGVDSDRTHISTKVKGTVGYLDPEYLKTYQLTPKSDVYSFGILLLEILTGRRPVEPKRPPDERVSIRWAFRKYNEGSVGELVDPLMQEVVDAEVLMRMFTLAFQSAAPVRTDRPDMKQVGEQLWSIRSDYHRSLRKE
ncbi:calmodulin-binding receptor-like cytoplasmic kinase 3 isoform X2 [Tripterygium wilfordii]|uniref:calmodulin-binding receptor-like cytoplasmic kinase 3 isoform X2 n=1 Tax=Tripterygium wilfordii TaxID=458696 RepID=UPI0018F7F387|nr:calmodulin-binding receptor-like cytoplasmic kinase 3 isoform X2 [Tripterygium wilfordii]